MSEAVSEAVVRPSRDQMSNTWSQKPLSAFGRAECVPQRQLAPLGVPPLVAKTTAVLNRVIDTLKLAFRVEFALNRLERVARAQARACRLGAPTPVRLAGHAWAVHRTGSGTLQFRLECRDAVLCLGDDKHGWSMTIEFRSVYLQTNGPYVALQTARAIAANLGVVHSERVRRLDLAVDVAGVDFDADELGHFVSRARRRAAYKTHSELSGFTFGKGDQMVRVYRKDKELEEHGDQEKLRTMHSQWRKAGWDGEARVWRYEIQARFKCLASFGADLPDECFQRLDALWRGFVSEDAATGAWLRLVVPESSTRLSRAATDRRWSLLEEVTWNLKAVVWTVRRSAKRGGASLEHVRGAALSYLASVQQLAEVTIDDAVERFRAAWLELGEKMLRSEAPDDLELRMNGVRCRFAALE